jgi:hypothetical protein
VSFVEAARDRTATGGPNGRCRFGQLIQTVPDPVLADEILEAMEDRTITLVAIERELKARGVLLAGRPLSRHTLERHRRGDCQCHR